jgi:hypothetical protein
LAFVQSLDPQRTIQYRDKKLSVSLCCVFVRRFLNGDSSVASATVAQGSVVMRQVMPPGCWWWERTRNCERWLQCRVVVVAGR